MDMDPNISAEADSFARHPATTTEVNLLSLVDAFWLNAATTTPSMRWGPRARASSAAASSRTCAGRKAVLEFEDTLVTVDIRAQHVWMNRILIVARGVVLRQAHR